MVKCKKIAASEKGGSGMIEDLVVENFGVSTFTYYRPLAIGQRQAY